VLIESSDDDHNKSTNRGPAGYRFTYGGDALMTTGGSLPS
jgi:hypothetical protein